MLMMLFTGMAVLQVHGLISATEVALRLRSTAESLMAHQYKIASRVDCAYHVNLIEICGPQPDSDTNLTATPTGSPFIELEWRNHYVTPGPDCVPQSAEHEKFPPRSAREITVMWSDGGDYEHVIRRVSPGAPIPAGWGWAAWNLNNETLHMNSTMHHTPSGANSPTARLMVTHRGCRVLALPPGRVEANNPSELQGCWLLNSGWNQPAPPQQGNPLGLPPCP